MKEKHPVRFSHLVLTGELWPYLADLYEQVEERLEVIIVQMKEVDGVMEMLKSENQMEWVGRMNQILICAEEGCWRNLYISRMVHSNFLFCICERYGLYEWRNMIKYLIKECISQTIHGVLRNKENV